MASSRDTGEMVDGKKHGYWITYYANGLKRSEGNYVHGKKDGPWIQYHKNGNVASEAFFRENKHEGEYICYYENGVAPTKYMTAHPLMGEKRGSGTAGKKMVKLCGVSLPIRKGALVRNRMNIHSANATAAAKVDGQPGAIISQNAAQNLFNNHVNSK